MRLSNQQIANELVRLREGATSRGTQTEFIKQFRSKIGVPDNTTWSRYETLDRSVPNIVLSRLVDVFPDRTIRLKAHLDSIRPTVLLSKRVLEITQQADGTWTTHSQTEEHVDLSYYLFADCAGNDVRDELRRRIPLLYGARSVHASENLSKDRPRLFESEPARYSIDQDGLWSPLMPLPWKVLTREQVVELAGEVPGELLDKAVFFGCPLPDPGRVKRLLFDVRNKRRVTLRDFMWRATNPHLKVDHKIVFRPLEAEQLESFTVDVFFANAEVVMHRANDYASCLISVGTQSWEGNGWMARWLEYSPAASDPPSPLAG